VLKSRLPERGVVSALIVVVMVMLGVYSSSGAENDGYKRSLYYRAVTYHHLVTSVKQVDLDGDGNQEVIVCYREPGDAVDLPGGILILGEGVQGYRVLWHGYFKGLYPRNLTVTVPTLDVEFVQTSLDGDHGFHKRLVHGKDFYFRGEAGDPFAKVKITASSTLSEETSPGNVMDGDLRSAWAEGAEGTGVGEKLVFEFPRPVNLGLIGMLHGFARSKRDWLDNNRVHRAEVTVETSADRYDTASEVDLDSDLGLGIYGDMVEMSFSNKPLLRYFRLEKSSVVSLEVKIASVLLGEKNDDAYIAEIDFAEMFTRQQLLGEPGKKQQAPAAKSSAKKGPTDEEKEDTSDWLEE